MFQTYHISMISTWIYSKEIYLKSNFDDPINSKSIYEVTITSRNLTKLIINGRNDAEFLIMKAVKFCSKLHHLELRNCRGLQCLLGLSDACLTTIGTFPSHIFYLLFLKGQVFKEPRQKKLNSHLFDGILIKISPLYVTLAKCWNVKIVGQVLFI